MKKIYLSAALCLLTVGTAFSQLSGSYTIGGTTPDYATPADAINAMNTSGVSGNVQFVVRDGIYSTSTSLIADTIPGATSGTKIEFVGESGDPDDVTINATANVSLFRLFSDGIFSFKNIKFLLEPAASRYVFELSPLTGSFLMDNCIVDGVTLSSGNSYGVSLYITAPASKQFDTLRVTNSKFRNLANGIYIAPYYTFFAKVAEVNNNTFEQTYNAIRLHQFGRTYSGTTVSGYSSGVTIMHNKVRNVGLGNIMAIIVESSNENIHVAYNEVYCDYDGTYSDIYGIMNSNNSSSAFGLSKWYNNVVYIRADVGGAGLYMNNGTKHEVFHNTVVMDSYKKDPSNAKIISAVWVNNDADAKFHNNNLVNLHNSTNATVYFQASYTSSFNYSNCFETVNNNNVFTQGARFALRKANSATGTTTHDFADFNEWKDSTAYDDNSISEISGIALGTGYTLDMCEELTGWGITTSVADDFNGTTRNLASPTIGAFEFTTPKVTNVDIVSSAGLVACDELNTQLQADIANGSGDIFPWGSYLWQIDGVNADSTFMFNKLYTDSSKVTVLWGIGNCIARDSIIIDINTADVTMAVSNSTICDGDSVVLVGTGTNTYEWDNAVSNDTLVDYPSQTTTYYLTGTAINGCEDVDTVIVNVTNVDATFNTLLSTMCADDPDVTLIPVTSGGVFSGPGVTGNQFSPGAANQGANTIVYTVTENGCTKSTSQIVMVDICASITEDLKSVFNISPNPTTGFVYLYANDELNIEVVNVLGAKVFIGTVNKGDRITIDLSRVSQGIYTVKSADGKYQTKLIKM